MTTTHSRHTPLPLLLLAAAASACAAGGRSASAPAGIRYGLSVTNGAVMSSYGDWDLRERLRTLQVPTLVVHGEEESILMDLVEEWVTSLPRALLLKVPNAAHFTYAERPELVWPAVEQFLAEPAPPASATGSAP